MDDAGNEALARMLCMALTPKEQRCWLMAIEASTGDMTDPDDHLYRTQFTLAFRTKVATKVSELIGRPEVMEMI